MTRLRRVVVMAETTDGTIFTVGFDEGSGTSLEIEHGFDEYFNFHGPQRQRNGHMRVEVKGFPVFKRQASAAEAEMFKRQELSAPKGIIE